MRQLSVKQRGLSRRNSINHRMVFYLAVFRVCLDAVYFGVLTGLYSYGGYKNNWNIGVYLLSWIITGIYILLSKRLFCKKDCKLSDYIVLFLVILIAIPSTTMIGAGIFSATFIVFDTVFWILIIFLQLYTSKKQVRPIVIKSGENYFDNKIIYFFAAVSFILVLYINLRYTHFRINFDINDAYDLRAQAKEYNLPTLIRYGFSWSRAVNNCMIAYALSKKKYPTAVLFMIAQILSFSIDGLKSTLFLPVIIIGVYILFEMKPQELFFKYAVNIISGLCISGVLEKRIFHTAHITLIFIRRVFFTPVLLNSYYLDFFSRNTPVYYRTIFGIASPYKELGKMIGGIYANRPNMNCNNGMLGDAMLNFGLMGVVIFPLLFIFLLWLIDKCSDGIDNLILISVAYYSATTLSNSVISTAFGTHGLLIIIVIFLLISGSNRKCPDKSSLI